MNQSSGRALRYLAGNENIEAVSTDDLQKLVDENPYFPVGRFLLASKLKVDNDAGFLPQVQKTALYFPNPFWLHFQLIDKPSKEPLPDKTNFIGETENDLLPAATKLAGAEAEALRNDAQSFLKEPEVKRNFIRKTEESQLEAVNKEEQIETANETSEKGIIAIIPYTEEKADQPEEAADAEISLSNIETKQFLDDTHGKGETFISINPVATEVPIFEKSGSTGSQEPHEGTEAFLNEPQKTPEENENENNTEHDEHEKMFQNIKAMLDAAGEEAKVDTENSVIPIDPYYTIDYFASQGIKLELDQNPKDELGQHLKKFTQWLKHMKKLGPEDATKVIAHAETDAEIQKIADASNTAREVVTEAMASVLEKQGKKDKAIELYNKLSFLYPDKIAYFAGKIKNLKGI